MLPVQFVIEKINSPLNKRSVMTRAEVKQKPFCFCLQKIKLWIGIRVANQVCLKYPCDTQEFLRGLGSRSPYHIDFQLVWAEFEICCFWCLLFPPDNLSYIIFESFLWWLLFVYVLNKYLFVLRAFKVSFHFNIRNAKCMINSTKYIQHQSYRSVFKL